jgi:hypothetical protein
LADACVDADPLVTHGAVDSLTLLTAAQLEHPSGTVASLLVSRASAESSDQDDLSVGTHTSSGSALPLLCSVERLHRRQSGLDVIELSVDVLLPDLQDPPPPQPLER